MKTLIVIVTLLFAASALAAAPCITPKVTSVELKDWKVVKTDFGKNGQMIRTVINPNRLADIKAVIYVYMRWMSKNPAGGYVIKQGIVRFCYLDKGKFHDFFLCEKCGCWHEIDTSQWPKEVIDAMVKRLMDALDGKNL